MGSPFLQIRVDHLLGLCGLLRVLHRMHQRPSVRIGSLSFTLRDLLKRNLVTVPLPGRLLILLEFRAVQRCTDERSLTAGVRQNASLPSTFDGSFSSIRPAAADTSVRPP